MPGLAEGSHLMFERVEWDTVVTEHMQQFDGDGAVPTAAVHRPEAARANHLEQLQLVVRDVPFFH